MKCDTCGGHLAGDGRGFHHRPGCLADPDRRGGPFIEQMCLPDEGPYPDIETVDCGEYL